MGPGGQEHRRTQRCVHMDADSPKRVCEHDDAVPDVPCDDIREVRMPTSEVSDAAADFLAGDEAEVGDPGCSFEPTKQESQM